MSRPNPFCVPARILACLPCSRMAKLSQDDQVAQCLSLGTWSLLPAPVTIPQARGQCPRTVQPSPSITPPSWQSGHHHSESQPPHGCLGCKTMGTAVKSKCCRGFRLAQDSLAWTTGKGGSRYICASLQGRLWKWVAHLLSVALGW